MAEIGIPMVNLAPKVNGNGDGNLQSAAEIGLRDLMTPAYWEAQVTAQRELVAQIEVGVAQLRALLAQQESRLEQAKGRLDERVAYLEAVQKLTAGG